MTTKEDVLTKLDNISDRLLKVFAAHKAVSKDLSHISIDLTAAYSLTKRLSQPSIKADVKRPCIRCMGGRVPCLCKSDPKPRNNWRGKMHERKSSIDEEFKTFWVPILFDEKNGRLNLEQLKKELYDYSMLLENVPRVYCEVSGGKISKPNTDPGEVISQFNDHVDDLVQEAIAEHDSDAEADPKEPCVYCMYPMPKAFHFCHQCGRDLRTT